MANVGIIAKLTALPGKRDELVAALGLALDNAEAEPGTLRYILHTDAKDEDLVWFYEQYTDAAALAAHGASDGMKALGRAVAPFVAGRPELTMVDVVGGKGV
jgi:quinol monooxygenase YgiN